MSQLKNRRTKNTYLKNKGYKLYFSQKNYQEMYQIRILKDYFNIKDSYKFLKIM